MSFHVAQMSMTNSPPAERKGQLLVILLSHKRRQCPLRLKKVNIISGAHAGKVRNTILRWQSQRHRNDAAQIYRPGE